MLCSKCNESADALTDNRLCPGCHMESEESRFEIISLARERHQEEGVLEIDDNAQFSEGGGHAYHVAAWVWVDFEGTQMDKEKGVICG